MSAILSKILANPDQTLVGSGNQAQVITRTTPEPTIRQKAMENNPLVKNSPRELSAAEKEVLQELQQLDQEVRMHEQMHMEAAGSLAKGPPHFEYQIGPDGKPYAIGGRVKIDTSRISGNPEENRARQNQIQNAAMAPGDPSIADQMVSSLSSMNHSSMEQSSAANGAGSSYQGLSIGNQATDTYQLALYA